MSSFRNTSLSAGVGVIEALNSPGRWIDNLAIVFPGYEFGSIKGVKYYKIFKRRPGGDYNSVFVFVNRKTGDIHHGAGWDKVGRKIGVVENWKADK